MCSAPVYRPANILSAHNARLFRRIDLRDVDPWQALISNLEHHLKLEQTEASLPIFHATASWLLSDGLVRFVEVLLHFHAVPPC